MQPPLTSNAARYKTASRRWQQEGCYAGGAGSSLSHMSFASIMQNVLHDREPRLCLQDTLMIKACLEGFNSSRNSLRNSKLTPVGTT